MTTETYTVTIEDKKKQNQVELLFDTFLAAVLCVGETHQWAKEHAYRIGRDYSVTLSGV
jgi:hypothetical protein